MPDDVDPQVIADSLDALIGLLEEYAEERWAKAFDRVREHVTVTVGATDTRSTARVVRDLLHMFRGGLGPFDGWTLERDGVVDEAATAELARIWDGLRAEVDRQLGLSSTP